jgi:hypothetical protein
MTYDPLKKYLQLFNTNTIQSTKIDLPEINEAYDYYPMIYLNNGQARLYTEFLTKKAIR